ncbi:hypothetical protein [Lysobacter sp. TAB13]|uniref:hypothetical protein n=1 Tax=Lysobacter sp. TAB13 TaxID=3233065 RepID=UPI003F9AA1D4
MDRQINKQGFTYRAMLAVGSTWLMLAFQGLAMRALGRVDLELLVTICVVTSVASLIAGLLSAALIRNNFLAMVVVSQLIATALVGFVARL